MKLQERMMDLFERFPLPWERVDWNGEDMIVCAKGFVIITFRTGEHSTNFDVDTLIGMVNTLFALEGTKDEACK